MGKGEREPLFKSMQKLLETNLKIDKHFWEMTKSEFVQRYGLAKDPVGDSYIDLPERSSIGKPNSFEYIKNYEGASYDVVRYNDEHGKCQGVMVCRDGKVVSMGLTPPYRGKRITQKMADVARENGTTCFRMSFGLNPNSARAYHRAMVRYALEDGENVPKEVLDDYPDLVSAMNKD